MSETFDYVVVGAGSAGAVIATRLTEDPNTTVLLLEAGGEADADEISIPAAFPNLFKTRWDWNYTTLEQKQLHSRSTYWPRMKALGGCSSMNAMIYIRGNRLDYDSWRDQYGATGWGYDDVLPYFIRAEANARIGFPFHGQSGPLHVEDRRYTHPLTDAWVAAAIADGMTATDDFNGATQEGVGRFQVTCHRGRRWSVDKAYLAPARKRTNLRVRTGALVSRILLDGHAAIGVDYLQGGEESTAHANAEVVLCCGAINSPQLLMLSGIGPAAHLTEVGVQVLHDLPGVGQNLHDHPAVPMVWHSKDTTDLAELNNLLNFGRAKASGTGPLVSNIGEGGGFFRSRDSLDAPDIQVHVAPTGFYDNGLHESATRKVTAAATLVSVASRGQIRLRATDPRWHPDIDPAYYDDQTDLDAMVAGCRRLLGISRQQPLARYLDTAFLPNTGNPSDTDLVEHVRRWTQTLYHPVGTCAMGQDERSVVGPDLKVRGIDRLRVADASVMPQVPRGNTNAPTIMIGEKAADLLRGRTIQGINANRGGTAHEGAGR
ncbi:MAG: GMC family oxidoreductase [Nakamurella sp.]